MFFHGAEWFLNNQDESGGWPSQVVFNKDRKKYPGAAQLEAGWYGAMCQGQAISVLVRAAHQSGDDKYLRAAEEAIKVFSVPSSQGGVKAVFLDKYPWYEEYPTDPPTFILNGFMYALLGLYDLKSVSSSKMASSLYKAGIESLAAMLPLYDSGASTFYDLRHFTMKTAPKVSNDILRERVDSQLSGREVGLSLHSHQPAAHPRHAGDQPHHPPGHRGEVKTNFVSG